MSDLFFVEYYEEGKTQATGADYVSTLDHVKAECAKWEAVVRRNGGMPLLRKIYLVARGGKLSLVEEELIR